MTYRKSVIVIVYCARYHILIFVFDSWMGFHKSFSWRPYQLSLRLLYSFDDSKEDWILDFTSFAFHILYII